MAEEAKEAAGEVTKSSPLIKNLIMFGCAILLPAIIAVVIYNVFVRGSIGGEVEANRPPGAADPYPRTMVEVIFDEQQISVQTEDPEMVAPLLIAQVLLMCRDQATANQVEARKPLFSALILRFHRGRTRTELNDSLVENSILEQIKQQSNILLRRLNPDADLLILDAQHLKFAIVDL